MSASGRSLHGRSAAERLASASAAQSISIAASVSGRADVASAIPSAAGGKSWPAVFARIYPNKSVGVPRKLTKKRPASDLKASISAPMPLQRAAVPTPLRGSASKPNADSQATLTAQRKPAPSSRGAVVSSRMASIPEPTQVRSGAIPSTAVHTRARDTFARRSASSKALPPLPSASAPPKAEVKTQSPRTVWPRAHPNPLRSNPPPAVSVKRAAVPVRRASNTALSIPKINGKRYTKRLGQMTILPVLPETSEHLPLAPRPVAPCSNISVPPSIIVTPPAVSVPSPPPRPASPMNLPDSHYSQVQQLKARKDLVEAAEKLKAENTQLYSDLQDVISQRIVAAAQLAQQKNDNLVLEATLRALWGLVEPNTGLTGVATTAQIREQVRLLSTRTRTRTTPKTEATPKITSDTNALEKRLDQQTQRLSFYRRSDAASREMVDVLVNENKQMKARLDSAEAERLQLRQSLDAATGKLQRIERSLFIYPTSFSLDS